VVRLCACLGGSGRGGSRGLGGGCGLGGSGGSSYNAGVGQLVQNGPILELISCYHKVEQRGLVLEGRAVGDLVVGDVHVEERVHFLEGGDVGDLVVGRVEIFKLCVALYCGYITDVTAVDEESGELGSVAERRKIGEILVLVNGEIAKILHSLEGGDACELVSGEGKSFEGAHTFQSGYVGKTALCRGKIVELKILDGAEIGDRQLVDGKTLEVLHLCNGRDVGNLGAGDVETLEVGVLCEGSDRVDGGIVQVEVDKIRKAVKLRKIGEGGAIGNAEILHVFEKLVVLKAGDGGGQRDLNDELAVVLLLVSFKGGVLLDSLEEILKAGVKHGICIVYHQNLNGFEICLSDSGCVLVEEGAHCFSEGAGFDQTGLVLHNTDQNHSDDS